MVPKSRRWLAAAILAAGSASTVPTASASYFNYEAWADLPEIARAMYISGAFDSYVIYSGVSAQLPKHFTGCLYEQKMNGDQLAENIFAFVETRPLLRTGSVQVALEQYLLSACGAPPSRPAIDAAFKDEQAPKNLMEIPKPSMAGVPRRKR